MWSTLNSLKALPDVYNLIMTSFLDRSIDEMIFMAKELDKLAPFLIDEHQ